MFVHPPERQELGFPPTIFTEYAIYDLPSKRLNVSATLSGTRVVGAYGILTLLHFYDGLKIPLHVQPTAAQKQLFNVPTPLPIQPAEIRPTPQAPFPPSLTFRCACISTGIAWS